MRSTGYLIVTSNTNEPREVGREPSARQRGQVMAYCSHEQRQTETRKEETQETKAAAQVDRLEFRGNPWVIPEKA